MPSGYGSMLTEIKERVRQARLRTVLAANASMVMSYWEVGRVILARQQAEGWGAKVIDRLSNDLREAFPDMQGLSPRNLKYMRAFASAWPEEAIVQRVVAQLPWKQNIALLDKLKTPGERLWYAQKAAQEGWSQPVLCLQIENRLHERDGRAQNNFAITLPPADSDLASQIFKDPYLFDFVGTGDPRREREVEQALVDHIQKFLLELGTGFAFVGRQVHLEVGSEDFYLDLLFYHVRLRRYIVVELKNRVFQPGDAGQMNLYLSAADDLLRHPDDQPAIGLLLCKGRNKLVVEYALRGIAKPIGVAEWKTQLVEALPPDLQSSLPTVAQIEAELAGKKIPKKGKP
ncbi:MAG: DUF1016 domain-containing protein [Verrucomicrobiaceae bacterium]|nr:DUF1016 domain-containing protein [Verrucomicrobiaceae bacterium]